MGPLLAPSASRAPRASTTRSPRHLLLCAAPALFRECSKVHMSEPSATIQRSFKTHEQSRSSAPFSLRHAVLMDDCGRGGLCELRNALIGCFHTTKDQSDLHSSGVLSHRMPITCGALRTSFMHTRWPTGTLQLSISSGALRFPRESSKVLLPDRCKTSSRPFKTHQWGWR